VEVQRRVGVENVQGMVALFDDLKYAFFADIERMVDDVKAYVIDLQSRGAVGALFIHDDFYYNLDKISRNKLSSSLCTVADIIPIMNILKSDAGALACPGAKLTASPGWLLPCCCDISLYLPGPCASSRGAL